MNPQIYSGSVPSALFKGNSSFSFANVSTNAISQTISISNSNINLPQILNLFNTNDITGQSNGLWFGGLMLQPTLYFNISDDFSTGSVTAVIEGICAGQAITDQVIVDLSDAGTGTTSYPFFLLFEQINTISFTCNNTGGGAANAFISIAQYINGDTTMNACLGFYRPNISEDRVCKSSIGFVNINGIFSYVPTSSGTGFNTPYWTSVLVGTSVAQDDQSNPAYWATENVTGSMGAIQNGKQIPFYPVEIQAATKVNVNTSTFTAIYKYMTLKLSQTLSATSPFTPISFVSSTQAIANWGVLQ